jgi:hypothetical protein
MVFYVMLKFLYEYVHGSGDSLEKDLIEKRAAVFFIPVVNIDGLRFLESEYRRTGNIPIIRKNKNTSYSMGGCPKDDHFEVGVDLNRNYGYGWGDGGLVS